MQNSYRLIATKILQRLCPKEQSTPCRLIVAFYSSHSTNKLEPDKCNDQQDFDQKKPINGKVAIITGGAQGIGFDLAHTLLRNGIKGVTLADNDCQSGEQSCICLCKEFGEGCAMFCNCDVMKSENMDCVFKKTLNHFKRIDLVINNAGIMNDKKWESEITVNIGGCVIGSLLGLQYMSKSCHGKGGVVVNLAHTAGIQPLCGCPIYTMTQSAIVGFTRALGSGCQYLRTGVKVLALCAGPTKTRMMEKLRTRAINVHFANELLQELELCQLQSTNFVSQGILKILSKGDSGSIWVAQNCKEAFPICFAEDMKLANQYNESIDSDINKSECVNESVDAEDEQAENYTIKSDEKSNKEMVLKNFNKVFEDQQFLCDQKAGNCPKRPDPEPCGSINLCQVNLPKQKFLPELSTSEVQLNLCLPPYESFPFCDSKSPSNSESKLTSGAQIICPDSSKSKIADSKSDGILISSLSNTLTSIFTCKKHSGKSEEKVQDNCKKAPTESVKTPENEKHTDPCDPKSKKQEVNCAPTSKKLNVDQKDVCKTLELCEELKSILSETRQQSKMSPKEALIKETQNTQLNYPYPPPEHPPSQQSVKLEKKTEEIEKGSGIGPKILNRNPHRKSTCKEPTATGVSTNLCDEIKLNKHRFNDLCSKLKSNNLKKDPCAARRAKSSDCKNQDKQKNQCKEQTSSQKSGRKEQCAKQYELCTKNRKQTGTRKELYKNVKASDTLLKNCTKNVECKKAEQTTRNKSDLKTGTNMKGMHKTSMKIEYGIKVIVPVLPPHLNRCTTPEWKVCENTYDNPTSPKKIKGLQPVIMKFKNPEMKRSKDAETDQTKSGKSKYSKQKKKIDGNMKSSNLNKPPSSERHQGITTQAGQYNAAKIPPDKCTEGMLRYDDNKVLKISKIEYVDEDNVVWKECTYECAQEDQEEKQITECLDNPIVRNSSNNKKPQISYKNQSKNEDKECDYQITLRGRGKGSHGFDAWPTSQQRQCDIHTTKRPKKSKRKPKGHCIPDPEEYEKMCMGSRIAWNRCPQFSIKLPNRPAEVSQGMRNAWSRCNESCLPDGEILAQQLIEESSCDKKAKICQEIKDMKNDKFAPIMCEEESEGMKKAWTQCHNDFEQFDELATNKSAENRDSFSYCEEISGMKKCQEKLNEDITTTNKTDDDEILQSHQNNDNEIGLKSESTKKAWAAYHNNCRKAEKQARTSSNESSLNSDCAPKENTIACNSSGVKYDDNQFNGIKKAWAACHKDCEKAEETVNVNCDVPDEQNQLESGENIWDQNRDACGSETINQCVEEKLLIVNNVINGATSKSKPSTEPDLIKEILSSAEELDKCLRIIRKIVVKK